MLHKNSWLKLPKVIFGYTSIIEKVLCNLKDLKFMLYIFIIYIKQF